MTFALLRDMTLMAAVAVSLVAVAPAPAVAGAPRGDATARAEALGAKARDAYRADDFDRAIELYIEAYETAASPGFLFNIAFVYDRKLGDAELARDYYQRVVAFPGADPEMVARARERLAELEATPRLPRPDPPPGPDPPPERPPAAPATPPTPAGGPPTAPMALVIGGGAVFAAGIVTGVVASMTESDFAGEPDLDRRRDLQSAGRTQALVADVLMVTGVVAAGVGAVLWLLDDGGAEPDGSVHVAPGVRFDAAVVDGGAMLTFGGSL